MTIAALLLKLPLLWDIFPTEVQQEWNADEVQPSMKIQQERTLAGLDEWKHANTLSDVLR